MKRTELFTKTNKSLPADETSNNAKLLIKAGFIHKELAGVYAYLPLGLIVIEKIKKVVREEMIKIGGQELLMTNIQRKDLWQITDRWDEKQVDIWFKSRLQNKSEIGLAWSHEEPITDMMKNFISSYRDLPVSVFQFQTKLRNELRAKSGILRGREFIMKDMYTFASSDEEHEKVYKKISDSYLKIFSRLGLGPTTFLTYASGGAFTKFSHEFQTLTDAGEDDIYLDSNKKLAINKEIYNDKIAKNLGLNTKQLELVKASEVGNIFSFGQQKTRQLGLNFTDNKGQARDVILGSYGIGITRLMGVIAELFSDANGLIWPSVVAPAQVYLIAILTDNNVKKITDTLYRDLTSAGVEVIYDDRNIRPGEMFADADLIGIPNRVVVSDKTLAKGKFEWKARQGQQSKLLNKSQLLKILDENN